MEDADDLDEINFDEGIDEDLERFQQDEIVADALAEVGSALVAEHRASVASVASPCCASSRRALWTSTATTLEAGHVDDRGPLGRT